MTLQGSAPGSTGFSQGAPEVRAKAVRSGRLALGAFVAYLVVAWWVLVFHVGSERWFFRDDWSFLAGRDGGSLNDVFRPENLHPSAVPVVAFRLMYNAFGLWFTPYLMMIVTMHLGVVVLLRVIMRRAGVGPWVSSAAAGTLVLFGPGEENILWALQINYVAAVGFGLTQLLLADHDGPMSRRDGAGVLAGVAAVLSSGIGPLMVVGVGLAALVRRGWQAALLHTAVPAAVYGTWYLVTHPREGDVGRPPAREMWNWVREGQVGTIDALGHVWVVAWLLALLLVAGLGLLVSSTTVAELRRRGAAPLALLACGPLLFTLIAQNRWTLGAETARSSRYVYIGAVLLLPALAIAGDAVARRWSGATILVVVVLLAGAPGNSREFGESIFDAHFFDTQRQIALGLPTSPLAEEVPRWVRPMPASALDPQEVTIGWLLDARDAGRLPAPGDLDPQIVAQFPILLGLASIYEPAPDVECRTESGPIDVTLLEGERLAIRSLVNVSTVANGKVTSPQVPFRPFPGTLSVELPSLDVRFSPGVPGGTFTLCR